MVAVNASSISRISISTDGKAGDGRSSLTPGAISADGRFITFLSTSSTFYPLEAELGFQQVFLRDTVAGTTKLVTLGFNGTAAVEGGYSASVSDDGRYVAFISDSKEYVPGEPNDTSDDVYVRDMWTGTTIKIPSVAPNPVDSSEAQISGDGRYVSYYNGNNIYRYDMMTFETKTASVSFAGTTNPFLESDISGDGRYVIFTSGNPTVVDNSDTNTARDIFLRDVEAETTIRVSAAGLNGATNGESFDGAVAANGRYVAFTSAATNLVAGDANGRQDVFIRDTVTGTTKLVSAVTGGAFGNGDSGKADVSADGRYVVFESLASNLVAGDVFGKQDIFLRDTVTGSTVALSVNAFGVLGNGDSYNANISDDGRFVTFSSVATNLVPNDTNAVEDVFRISLFASEAADQLFGSAGADTILALGGSDIIRGGAGADVMNGGAGNDTFYVDSAGDVVVEAAGGGFDTVITSVNYTLGATVQVESLKADPGSVGFTPAINLTGNGFSNTLVGNGAANTLIGGAGIDVMSGGSGNDTFVVDNVGDRVLELAGQGTDTLFSTVSLTLAANQSIERLLTTSQAGTGAINLAGNEVGQTINGNAGINALTGNGGNDILTGFAGNDVLHGGDGNDQLNGGTGSDTFVFSAALNAATNVDILIDFNVAADTMRLENGFFTALTTGGILAADAFMANTSGVATETDDRIIYETDTGKLFYDSNGSTAEGSMQFAQLTANLQLTNSDFFIV